MTWIFRLMSLESMLSCQQQRFLACGFSSFLINPLVCHLFLHHVRSLAPAAAFAHSLASYFAINSHVDVFFFLVAASRAEREENSKNEEGSKTAARQRL